MRKIEKEMVEAIVSGKDWRSGNTQVASHDGDNSVWLFGNHIATITNGVTYPDKVTLRLFPTVTTMSRLRALGVDVCQRNSVVYLDGEPV